VHIHNEEQVRYVMQCFSALHDISNLFLVMYMHAITNLCSENKTPKTCFMALHHRSNLLLVMHMHAITNLCALKHILGVFFSLHRG